MSEMPTQFQEFRLRLEARWSAFRLRRLGDGLAAQTHTLRRLLEMSGCSDFGKVHRLHEHTSYELFRQTVPLKNYANYLSLIESMKNGADHVIWPGSCRTFVSVPGLPGEATRSIPFTREFSKHLRLAWRKALLLLALRDTNNALKLLDEDPAGYLCTTAAAGVISTRLLVDPPKLSPQSAVRHHDLHEVALCEAALFGAQDTPVSAKGLLLLTDVGVFYEFVPVDAWDPSASKVMDAACMPLSKIKCGIDYVLVLSSPCGLLRYDTGELVRFLDLDPPRFLRLGNVRQVLNLCGERVTERQLQEALSFVCSKHAWRVVFSHVAPMNKVAGSRRGRSGEQHEWWVELMPGTQDTPTGPVLSLELDEKLRALNPGYAQRRANGSLEAPVVRLVMPGVFDAWLHGLEAPSMSRSVPLALPDRRIADALAQVARFHE